MSLLDGQEPHLCASVSRARDEEAWIAVDDFFAERGVEDAVQRLEGFHSNRTRRFRFAPTLQQQLHVAYVDVFKSPRAKIWNQMLAHDRFAKTIGIDGPIVAAGFQPVGKILAKSYVAVRAVKTDLQFAKRFGDFSP